MRMLQHNLEFGNVDAWIRLVRSVLGEAFSVQELLEPLADN